MIWIVENSQAKHLFNHALFRNPVLFGEDEFESYLSLVLTTISITSILITLLTYSLFSELRNLPGLNLMALCITLLAYQVFMKKSVAFP